MDNPEILILCVVGILSIFAGIFDWGWWMNSSKARFFVG